MRLVPCLVAATAAVLAVPAQGRLTPETLWRLQRLGELVLSPDGRWLAYTVRTTELAEDRSTARVFVLDLTTPGAGPREFSLGSQPTFRKEDGVTWLAVVTPGAVKEGPVASGPLAGGAISIPLAAEAGNLRWSPDRSWLAYTQDVVVDALVTEGHKDLPKANARAYDDLWVRHWDHWLDGRYSHLFVRAALHPEQARDLMAGERADTPMPPFGGAEQIAWAPDGSELCYTAKKVKDPEQSTDSSLWVVPVGGGPAKNLTPELPGYDQEPCYSPDGRWIAFLSMARAGFESDRLRLWLHDRKAGTNRELLRGFEESAHELRWTADSQQVFFTAEVQGTTQLFRTSLADGAAVQVTRGRHELGEPNVAADGRTVYALRTTMERPAEVVKIDVASGALTALTDHNGPLFAGLSLPTIDAEWFPTSDGKQVHSWIVKPPGFDPARKYPFVLYCQGGPQSMVGQSFSLRWNFHLMAAQGYVVAGVNRRGLPGFGQQWNDQISRDWGGQPMRDLLAVTDAMRQRPYIDRDHCAAVGASFGGYTVYWLMGNAGDRFACMIAHCGVFNLESMSLETEELWFPDWDLGGPYWKSAEAAADFARFSPHHYVQNWKTPLLVIHGEQDFRVPYDQGLQAFTAAQRMGVTSRLLVFPDECHWILRPQDCVLWQREFFGWLDRFCKPAAPDHEPKK